MPNFPGNDLRLLSLKVGNSPRKGPWGALHGAVCYLVSWTEKIGLLFSFFRKEIKIGAFSVAEA
jgi:hypothetical protein